MPRSATGRYPWASACRPQGTALLQRPELGLVKTPTEVTLAIDGGFVRLQPAADIRNFEILTGRIACPGERPYVFAWVRSEGGPMQERLTALMRAKTAAAVRRR